MVVPLTNTQFHKDSKAVSAFLMGGGNDYIESNCLVPTTSKFKNNRIWYYNDMS